MKNLIAGFLSLFLITTASVVYAGPHHKPMVKNYHHKHWHHRHGWVVPALVGGSVVYLATRPDTVVVQPQPPLVLQPDQMIIDGIVYIKQTIIINGEQKEVFVKQ